MIRNDFDQFKFAIAYKRLYTFCNEELSSFYLDILKDRLYTFPSHSSERKSAQTVLYHILNHLVRVMAPIFCFSAEEIYLASPKDKQTKDIPSVHLLNLLIPPEEWTNKEIEEKNIVLEEARKMCEMAREVGMYTHTYWIIGVPYETRQTALKTISTMRYWLEEDISSASEVNLLVGYPRTHFYENPGKYGITWQDADFSHYDGRNIPTFATKYLTVRDTEYLFHLALDEYCTTMAKKIGSKDAIMRELGRRLPNFDPAVMEAAF